jgi:hypothetical protein
MYEINKRKTWMTIDAPERVIGCGAVRVIVGV